MDIALDEGTERASTRKQITFTKDGSSQKAPLYIGSEDVVGVVHLRAAKGKKIDLDHNGVRLELIGQIEMFHDRGNTFQFVTLEKDLAPAGRLAEEKDWPFEFKQVEKQVRGCVGLLRPLFQLLRVSTRRSAVSTCGCATFCVSRYLSVGLCRTLSRSGIFGCTTIR